MTRLPYLAPEIVPAVLVPVQEILRVCAWCPPEVRAPVEAAAAAAGAPLSHGICDTHAAQLRADLNRIRFE